MIGENFFSVRGWHLSFTLITLTFTIILLWAWEENPFVNTLHLARDQFSMFSSVKPRDSIGQNDSNLTTREDSKKAIKGFGASPSNSTTLFIPEAEDTDSNKTYSKNTVKPNESMGQNNSVLTTLGDSKKPIQSFDASTSHSMMLFPPEEEKRDSNKTSSSTNTVCNYAKGRWVADRWRPLYSGSGCKQWLSGMWACRLTQRTDFSFEGYRWQPKNCKALEFERSEFLRRMQDKTIAFIGDSLGRQQFQSLMCMATGGEESPEVENIGWEYGLVKARGTKRPDGWAYRFLKTNTTILYYWSSTLCDLVSLNITDKASNISLHLDRLPAFMTRFLDRFDVLVLNTGHHWNEGKFERNRWVMYMNEKLLEDKNLLDIRNAKNFTVHNVVRWLGSQLSSHPRLKVFFRTISPRHFNNGDWNTGGSCDNTTPLTEGSEVTQDGSNDTVVDSAVKGTRIKILDITALSALRDEGHISHYSIKKIPPTGSDCLHWCLPGIPDTWNELLAAQV